MEGGFQLRRLLAIVLVLGVGLVAATGANAAPQRSGKVAGGCAGSMVVKTKTYVFSYMLGPFTQMYTPAQVKAKHLKTGEVMVSGQMMGMHGSMSSQRHLEVHICSRASGKVVTDAHPSITFEDLTAKSMKMTVVPVAAMYGIKQGPSDYHYGNNVTVTPGHTYQTTVKLNGQTATFKTKVSKM